jgi:hypothetical protein
VGPNAAQGSPEEPVQPIQTGTGPLPLENCDLLPQGEDLQGGVLATAEEDSDCAQEGKDEFEHESYVVTCVTTSAEGLRHAAASC